MRGRPLHGMRCIVFAAIATSSVRGFSAVFVSVCRHAGGSVRLVSSLMDTDKTTAMIDSSCRRVYGCAFSPKRRNSDWQLCGRNRRQDTGPSDEPSSFSLMDAVFTPTPGLSDSLKVLSIPLLALILYAIFVDPSAAFTTMILFASLRTLAIRLVLFPQLPDTPRGMEEEKDDDERKDIIFEQLQIDAFCFGISASSVLIVGPDFSPLLIVASIATIVLLLATSVNDIVNEEQLNEDDKLLNQWDKRFRKQNNIDDTN